MTFSNQKKEDFLSGLIFAVRQQAERLGVKDRKSLIAIGLIPVSAGAEEWLGSKNEQGLFVSMCPLVEGASLNPEMMGKTDGYAELMAHAKQQVEGDRDNGVPRNEVHFVRHGEHGAVIYYEAIEHDYSFCQNGGKVALEIYIYIGHSDVAMAEEIAWAAEEPIMQWAETNNDMWTQTHKPE